MLHILQSANFKRRLWFSFSIPFFNSSQKIFNKPAPHAAERKSRQTKARFIHVSTSISMGQDNHTILLAEGILCFFAKSKNKIGGQLYLHNHRPVSFFPACLSSTSILGLHFLGVFTMIMRTIIFPHLESIKCDYDC